MTPEQPFDPELRTLQLRGLPVTYTEDGADGPAFVCVHGLPGSVHDFRWLGAALREVQPDARVVRLDMPGFGGTDEGLGGDMTVDARAGFVADVLAALGLEQVILIGHSMGGAVTLGTAAVAPERVRHLVLLASVGRTPHRMYRSIPNAPLVSRIFCNPLGRRLLPGVLHRAFVRAGFPSSTPTSDLFVTARAVGALRFATVRELAAQVADRGTPAHLYIAEDDRLVERSIAEDLAETLGSPLRVFDRGGHNIQKTRARELAGELADIREALIRTAG